MKKKLLKCLVDWGKSCIFAVENNKQTIITIKNKVL